MTIVTATMGWGSARARAFGDLASWLTPAALLAAIGVELAVLVAYLPDTLHRGWNGPTGDFHNLYVRGRDLQLMALYNPVLTPLMHPLSWLGEMNAYRAFFAMNAASVLAIAYIAQRGLPTLEARVAIALAVVSLPQMQWAMRFGHLTPMLALVVLSGFLLLRRHPRIAAAVFSLLSIKPQYAVAPFLYLAFRRQWRLMAVMLGTAAVGAVVGFASIGPGSVREFISLYFDWLPNSTGNLLPVQQAWMYSWPGFLISIGVTPNPLLTFDLLLLSAAIVGIAWSRVDAPKAAAVAALAMIPLTPYSQVYDAGLLAAALALIVRSGMRPAVTAVTIGALYLAALATQANTHFPVKDLLGPGETNGIFWLTPALLAAVCVLAISGRAPEVPQEAGDGR